MSLDGRSYRLREAFLRGIAGSVLEERRVDTGFCSVYLKQYPAFPSVDPNVFGIFGQFLLVGFQFLLVRSFQLERFLSYGYGIVQLFRSIRDVRYGEQRFREYPSPFRIPVKVVLELVFGFFQSFYIRPQLRYVFRDVRRSVRKFLDVEFRVSVRLFHERFLVSLVHGTYAFHLVGEP